MLEANVPNCVVDGAPTPQTTGAFEVTNADTGAVYWSKMTTEKRHCESKEDLNLLLTRVKSNQS